jgi:hypothetical protein
VAAGSSWLKKLSCCTFASSASSSNVFECNGLPTEKVVSYKIKKQA